MPDITDLLRKWWKRVLLVVMLSTIAVGGMTFLKPRQYLGVATSVVASSFSSDRGKIFNENLQTLYSSLGTPDDLDLILGTGQLDTLYLAVTDQFNLFDHYKVKEKGNAARVKAASILKGNTRVQKSAYGELKVKVWDTDQNLVAQLANGIMNKLQSIHQDLQSEGNRSTLAGLLAGREKLRIQIDSIKIFLSTATFPAGGDDPYTTRLQALTAQLSKYEKLATEYELLLISKPSVLITVERATTPEWPNRPKRIQVLVATAILAFFFSLLLVLVLERRKLSGS